MPCLNEAQTMKPAAILSIVVLSTLLAACQPNAPVCPAVAADRKYLASLPTPAPSMPAPGPSPTPAILEINHRAVSVSKVVRGPLCNDTWQGTVYVGCDVQVRQWVDQPLFLKGCNLSIEPGTVVYVAAHNNAAFYQGCSCHTGVQP